jgi:hypothetical protein
LTPKLLRSWGRRGFIPSKDNPLILFRSIADIAASLRWLGCSPITKQGSRNSGFRDVANFRHRAKHSRHHAKDKQRFVVSVVTYDSLPGHQTYDILRFSTIFRDERLNLAIESELSWATGRAG